MKLRIVSIFSVMTCLVAGAAHANWQAPGNYRGWTTDYDDGSRFIMSFRGGASIINAGMSNDVGSLTTEYFIDPNTNMVISAAYYDACVASGGCGDFQYAGIGDMANLPVKKDLGGFSFAAGGSIGWTMPQNPQWRVELGWDHISETEYNTAPLFDGDLELTSGAVINVQSGGVQSSVTTDILSVMAFYDFYDGMIKPMRKAIPYVGFGLGYADSKTILNLADLYGDLSWAVDLENYGERDPYDVIQFYKSEKTNANIAGLLAFGVSYGVADNVFLDFGARLTYVPQIKWALSNEDGSKHRDWFSAKNVIYGNIMMGVRLEF